METVMTAMSQRERRLVAILILIAVIAALWLGILSPLLGGFADRAEQRVSLQQQFVRNERQIATISRLRRNIEQQRFSNADYRTAGETVTAASEAVKERLSNLVSASGGELRAVQDVSDRPGWARVWVEAKMTLPQLVSTLTKVQNQTPFLAVNGVTISADRALQSGKLDIMDARIEVSSPIALTKSR
jgi:type II secretory pathway component PulM